MNYVADIRGDLIFNGFETAAIAPPRPDEHDLNLSSDQIGEMAPVAAMALEPEQIVPFEATESTALEPHADSTPCNICSKGTPDSSPAISSGPCTLADTELDRLSVFEFSAADVFQHSPLGDVLDSLKNLSLEKDSQLNYIRFELEADDGEFCFPPATHFIATVDDLTDVLDYSCEDIAGMDDDADMEQDQDRPFTGCQIATSSYDVYMVDTPKEASDDDKGDPVADKASET